MAKRKDTKGIVLRKGESQRKDGLYQYRYTSCRGKRESVYAPSLAELRKKEEQIAQQEQEGVSYAEGNITVSELVDRYLQLKGGIKESTQTNHGYIGNVLRREEFGKRPIRSVKTSDAKLWFMELQKKGLKKGTIENYKHILSPAFDMAVEEDVLRKNPFNFKMGDVIREDAEEKTPLTPEETVRFIEFCKTDKILKDYVDEFIILLETGMRASEMCGLTKKDVDIRKGTIDINKQLSYRTVNGKLVLRIDEPKTASGRRILPMTDEVKSAFRRILEKRKTVRIEPIVDGVGGFIFLTNRNTPKNGRALNRQCTYAEQRYNKANPMYTLPHITPHVFRHTFCTNMANSGMDVKALQYLMGHADVHTTMNVYAHKSYEHAAEQFELHKENLQLDA